ncbi:MAG: SGNH/GDSL hydrolase family protein, partial [Clostridia bacterium]|nr:SGNH/GDSL hydrolase family protein [Clostridia bacterium]
TEVQAAIGGTGSELGVYRCDNDLTAKKPDLIFYEFSVNDAGSAYKKYTNNTESTFRKIYAANPSADIIVVHTITQRVSNGLNAGREFISRSAHTMVAHHYDVPCFEMGEVLRAKVNEAGGDWLKYTMEGVHPNDDGYAIYFDALKDWVLKHFEKAKELDAPAAKVLPERIFKKEESLEFAHMEDAYGAELGEGWSKIERDLCCRYPHYIEATEPGAELNFRFIGKRIGLYFMLAPDAGDVEYSIDGTNVRTVRTWDGYSMDYPRAGHAMLDETLEYGEHVVKIKVSSEKAEMSKGTAIRIGAFMIS